MMNICFFSQEYPPETHAGGIGTYTYNMASALREFGHTVHVITSTENSKRIFQDSSVWIHRIKKQRIKPKELCDFVYSYAVARKIYQVNCEFDIVQSSEFASEAFYFALKKKIPLVTRLATPFFLTEKLNGKSCSGLRRFSNWMEKKQTLWSDGILTSTRALAKAATEEWRIEPSRVEIIPNSVDLSRIIQLGKNIPARDILENKDFLLYFGRLEKRKGIHVLARALFSVFERFPHLNMVFVGRDLGYRGSSMREHIRKMAGKYWKQLIFFDNLPHEKLFPIVNLAKIVILPSLWEAFGFVCVEAMTLGCPVIATSGSGFEEIIENNISGYLVEPGNSEILAEKIIHSLKDEEDLRRISKGARKRAQDFEVSRVSSKLIDYYEKIREEWLQKREDQ